MATGTTSPNVAGILSDEETNYLRAAHLIIHICPKAVRILFDSHHPPPQLTGQLAAKQATLQNCKGIDKRHWPMLFPVHGIVKSSDFDITLLMTLLRNFTLIPQPRTRWDTMPAANDKCEGADLVRIRLYRNQIVHSSEATLSNSDFKLLWTELEAAIDRLSGGTMKSEVNDLRNVVLDQTQRELLLTSIQHEKELRHHKEEIKEIRQKHGEEIDAIKQKHEEEMKKHGEEIAAIRQRHETEMKGHGEKIEAIKERHEAKMKGHGIEIEAIKQTHKVETEAIKQKHEDEMEGHGEKIEAIKQKHGEEIKTIKQRHEEEMKQHGEEIAAIKQKHEAEIKGHGEEIEAIKQRHEEEMKGHGKEIKAIKQTHKVEIETIKQKHEDEMEGHGEKIEAFKQRHEEEIEAITKKHEEEMKIHGEKIEAIEQKHEEEMKIHGEEIEAMKQKHEKEIEAFTQKHEEEMKIHGEKIESIEQKHEEEMKTHGKEIEAIKQKHEEEVEALKKKHEDEMKEHREEIGAMKEKHEEQMRETIPHNIRVQHKKTLEQWKKYDMVFFETTGYKEALELLNSKNYITIIASPGAGKSTIAQHIALKMENEGWEVVPIDGPDDLIKYGSFNKKQVFVIDDVVGVFSAEMPRLDAFSRRRKEIQNLIQNQTKLIMTCRKVVYNEVQKYKSLVTDFVLDLENSDFKLGENEKTKILLNHCKAAKISPELYENIPLSNAKMMFPLLCKLFCKEQKYQKMGKQFFERPNECVLEKMEDLKQRAPLQYAGLVLLCLKMKNVLCQKECESDVNFQSLKKTVFDIYGVNHGTPASEIIKSLSLLDGTYTRPASDGFTFIHDSIFELVAYHHGNSYPEHILKYSSSSYFNNRITVEDIQSDGSLYIKLEKKHYPLLAERILDEIRTLKLYDVFKNPVLKNGEFLDVFLKILQEKDFRTIKELFLVSHHGLREPDTSDESDTSEQRTKDFFHTNMWKCKRILLEAHGIRVIRWIVFYGPTRLLEFVINLVKRRTNIVERLVHQVTNQCCKVLFGKKDQTWLLVIGCFSGDVDRVRLILQHVDPSCVNTSVDLLVARYTPLTAACRCGHLAVVDVLIQHRARVDIPDKSGYHPLCRASERGHCDIVRYLIDHGADTNIHHKYRDTPLYIASERGHCDIVRCLIDHGADPNLPGMFGYTPLYSASKGGHCDVVRYLIDHGADPNIHTKYGDTPLCSASEFGHCDVVRYLLDHGADPNILLHVPGCRINTPLYIASEKGHCDIVRYLIDYGADPNKHRHGNIPLIIASEKGHCDIVRHLIDHGDDPKKTGYNGITALYRASEKGHCDIVRYLIDHGADPSKPDMFGNTPLYIALERGHCDIVTYLIDHGADRIIHK